MTPILQIIRHYEISHTASCFSLKTPPQDSPSPTSPTNISHQTPSSSPPPPPFLTCWRGLATWYWWCEFWASGMEKYTGLGKGSVSVWRMLSVKLPEMLMLMQVVGCLRCSVRGTVEALSSLCDTSPTKMTAEFGGVPLIGVCLLWAFRATQNQWRWQKSLEV